MNKTNHVCFIISSFSPIIGGAERATENLCRALLKSGLDVVVLTRRYPGTRRFEEIEGIPVHRLGCSGTNKFGALTFAIHAILFIAVHLRSYRIIHVQNIETPLFVGLACKILLRRVLVATIHGASKFEFLKRRWLGRVRLRLMGLLVDRATAINQETVQQYLDIGIPDSCIQRIPNGIDTRRFDPPSDTDKARARSKLNIDTAEPVILFLGRLVPVKRVDLLLHAFARLTRERSHRLIIVGGGVELNSLQKLAGELGINVRFEGPRQDVVTYLQAADIFVLPSGNPQDSSQEGLSVALIEAMSVGLTVIVTDCPGNRTLVKHNANGLIFPVGDLNALTTHLERVLQSSELRKRLGKDANRSVVEEYSIQAVARKTADLYLELPQNPARTSLSLRKK